MKPAYELQGKPKLLVVDGAGTLFDPGSVAPAYAFQHSFKHNLGLDIEFGIIMRYMGMDKREHVRKLFREDKDVPPLFLRAHHREPTVQDEELVYNGFKEGLYATVKDNTKEIEGAKEAAYKLKATGIPLVMTTGYDRKTVDLIREKLTWLDDVLLTSVTASDVKKGRPAPYLIFHAMEVAGVENVAYAVNVGDTEVDTGSADNAYMPGITVTSGSLNGADAIKLNETLGRKHLVLPSLVDVINFTLNGTLGDKIRELNK